MLLSIISPTYNEAQNVEKLVKLIEISLSKYKYEIIFFSLVGLSNIIRPLKTIHKSIY